METIHQAGKPGVDIGVKMLRVVEATSEEQPEMETRYSMAFRRLEPLEGSMVHAGQNLAGPGTGTHRDGACVEFRRLVAPAISVARGHDVSIDREKQN